MVASTFPGETTVGEERLVVNFTVGLVGVTGEGLVILSVSTVVGDMQPLWGDDEAVGDAGGIESCTAVTVIGGGFVGIATP